ARPADARAAGAACARDGRAAEPGAARSAGTADAAARRAARASRGAARAARARAGATARAAAGGARATARLRIRGPRAKGRCGRRDQKFQFHVLMLLCGGTRKDCTPAGRKGYAVSGERYLQTSPRRSFLSSRRSPRPRRRLTTRVRSDAPQAPCGAPRGIVAAAL